MADTARFYWLKLKRDFFKRHDIRIIESMPNGKEYILFYLKLLCESVDHDGNLRFSDQIPYSEEMLSTITNTNIDIVRSAINIFTQLGMMDIFDDGTFFMNEVERMIGSAANNDNANRQRRFRERQKALALSDSYDSVTKNNESKSKSKSKSKNNNMANLEDEFEQLWSIYPNKKGSKKKALEAYKRARQKGTSFDDVQKGINDYVLYIKTERIEKQFVKHGSTFFSQNAWEATWLPENAEIEDDLDGIL